jgi:hypothetical protein
MCGTEAGSGINQVGAYLAAKSGPRASLAYPNAISRPAVIVIRIRRQLLTSRDNGASALRNRVRSRLQVDLPHIGQRSGAIRQLAP